MSAKRCAGKVINGPPELYVITWAYQERNVGQGLEMIFFKRARVILIIIIKKKIVGPMIYDRLVSFIAACMCKNIQSFEIACQILKLL